MLDDPVTFRGRICFPRLAVVYFERGIYCRDLESRVVDVLVRSESHYSRSQPLVYIIYIIRHWDFMPFIRYLMPLICPICLIGPISLIALDLKSCG